MSVEREWVGPSPPLVVYVYADGRGGKHVAKHLERFSGVVQVDVYAGYNILEKEKRPAGRIKLVFCWTHLRRRFYEFHKSTGSPIVLRRRSPPANPSAEKRLTGSASLMRSRQKSAASPLSTVRSSATAKAGPSLTISNPGSRSSSLGSRAKPSSLKRSAMPLIAGTASLCSWMMAGSS